MSKRKYTTIKFTGEFLGIVGRVLRSFLFNLLMFILGFTCSYIMMTTNVTSRYFKNYDEQFVQQLEQDIKQYKKIVINLEKQLQQCKENKSYQKSIANK